MTRAGASAGIMILGRFLKSWCHPNLTVPGLLLLLCMGIFFLERVLLLLTLSGRFESVDWHQLLQSLLIGVRFDIVMSCTIAAPIALILCISPRLLWSRAPFRLLMAAICGLLVALTVLACTVDFLFFRQFDTHLDWKVFNYLEYDYVYGIIRQDYPLIPILIAVAAVLAGSLLLFRARCLWYSRACLWQRVVIAIVIPVVLFLGVRNSVGPKPINAGPAYFTNHLIVSQLTLNGLFTLREAAYSRFYRQKKVEPGETLDITQDQAIALTQSMLRTNRSSYLEDHPNPLQRRVQTEQPRQNHNVVIVVMESLSWQYIEALGGHKGLTPNLDRCAEQGVLMDRCFAVGSRTTYGMSGIVSGFPDLPGESVTTRQRTESSFVTIGSILRDRGYHTMFVYGGQAMYDHRQAYLGSNGFSEFITQEDFEHTTFETELGWCDGDLFREADARFRKKAEKDEPFLGLLLTLSFHRPFKVPSGKVDPVEINGKIDRTLTAVKYTDWAIGRFLRKAREASYFDNTIFVFTADHTGGSDGHPISPVNYRVPFIIYAPEAVKQQGRRISRVCSQTDIAPTILSLLGGTYEHGFFGTDVLHDSGRENFAFLRNGSHAMALIEEDNRGVIVPFNGQPQGFRLQPPGQMSSVETPDKTVAEQCKKAWAIQQTASQLFYNQRYE